MRRKTLVVVLTEHGRKRIKDRVMSQERYKTSDAYLLADMALKKGRRPAASFQPHFAVRPEGFSGFIYKEYGRMIYCYGVKGSEAHLLTVYYADQELYKRMEEQKIYQSTPLSVTPEKTVTLIR